MRLVIVTDLDGTLLDAATRALGPAEAVVGRVVRAGVPLVLSSSKTRAEIEALQRQLGLAQPFIAENGGAIVAPPGSFADGRPAPAGADGRFVIELGRPYREVVAIVREAAEAEGVRVVGFSDMTVGDLAADSGLSPLEAQLAKLREYDEPFRLIDADTAARRRFLKALRRRGLQAVAGGRYDHAMGDTDKGRAVEVLRGLYRDRIGPVVLAGLGDAMNDLPMLRAVDHPVIVRGTSDDSTVRLLRQVPDARVTQARGPAGWAEAVTAMLDAWEGNAVRVPPRFWPGLA
ncbi:MAG TPA: HAD-IIB family hydrolase [Vicinamibacterales bacterium]|nr:HAD-IIB family hydrolase [Vicinamibacterales bacterium]